MDYIKDTWRRIASRGEVKPCGAGEGTGGRGFLLTCMLRRDSVCNVEVPARLPRHLLSRPTSLLQRHLLQSSAHTTTAFGLVLSGLGWSGWLKEVVGRMGRWSEWHVRRSGSLPEWLRNPVILCVCGEDSWAGFWECRDCLCARIWMSREDICAEV